MAKLVKDITEQGLDQGDLVKFLANVRDLVNELRTDYTALRVDVAAIRTAFVALTAKMDADFADVTNASTDYAATVDPAALTSTTVDASAVTLSKG